MNTIIAQGREKNNIIHLFDGKQKDGWRGTYEVSQCGSVSKSDAPAQTHTVDVADVTGEEYLVINGTIIGKLCGNCESTL